MLHKKYSNGIGIVAALLFLCISLASAQENPPAAEVAQPETLWLWGEVVSIDNAKGEITIKYLDYDTDQEKEIAVGIDDKTTYENTKGLLDIKPQDTVSIDYIVGSDSKNIAKNISVEKPDAEGMMQEDLTAEQPQAPELPEAPAAPEPAAQQ